MVLLTIDTYICVIQVDVGGCMWFWGLTIDTYICVIQVDVGGCMWFWGLTIDTYICVIQVDVGGCMWFWGLTIDTVTTINLIIAIGLTVDYSAHIAHTFMVTAGDKNGTEITFIIIIIIIIVVVVVQLSFIQLSSSSLDEKHIYYLSTLINTHKHFSI